MVFSPLLFRPLIDEASSENVGAVAIFGSMIIAFVLSISALVTGFRVFKQGERSWVLWVGFIPAILAGLFWIFMIMGEFIFPH